MKIKAQEKLIKVGKYSGTYRYVMRPETYSRMDEDKVLDEAAAHSGIQRGLLSSAWAAIAVVVKNWATEGHSVPIPGLGTMRFSINSKTAESANDVASSLIKCRKVIFTPSTDIKKALKDASVSITCYDRNGDAIVNNKPGTTTGTTTGGGGSGSNFEG